MAKFLILALAVLAILTAEVSANARVIPTTTTTTTTTTHAPSPIHLNATEPASCLPPESAIDITARPGPHCRGLHWVWVSNATWANAKYLVKSGQRPSGKPMYVCRCLNCGPDDVLDQTFPGWVSSHFGFLVPHLFESYSSQSNLPSLFAQNSSTPLTAFVTLRKTVNATTRCTRC